MTVQNKIEIKAAAARVEREITEFELEEPWTPQVPLEHV
jgi:hypothetical protein